jgi:hypothetical protein
MAKGLKVGDAVTVRKEMRLAQKSEAFKAGLKRLKPGLIGKVVDVAQGRSVVVDFEGKRVTLASQRLDKSAASEKSGGKGGKRGPRATAATTATPGTTSSTVPIPDERSLIDYNNPQFITTVANKLLTTSGLEPDPETVVMQIKLSDLPVGIREQVRSLMHAKLALPPQMAQLSSAGTGIGTPRRRGRPPKKQA